MFGYTGSRRLVQGGEQSVHVAPGRESFFRRAAFATTRTPPLAWGPGVGEPDREQALRRAKIAPLGIVDMDDVVQIGRVEARDDALTRMLDEVGVVVAVRRQAAAASCPQDDRPVIPDPLILCREKQNRRLVRREPADPPPGDTLRPGLIEAAVRGDFRLTAAPRVVLPDGPGQHRYEVIPWRGVEAVMK